MSDIAIRLDGLLLAASLILASSIYMLVALVAGAAALMTVSGRPRLLDIARRALLLGALSFVVLIVAAAYIEYADQRTSGPDMIDCLSLPVMILFAIGCVALARRRPASPR